MPDQNPITQIKKRQPAQQSEEKEEEYKPKLSTWEIVIITPFYLISDTLELLLFLTALTDFGMISLVRTSVSEFYFVIIKKMGKEIWQTSLVVGIITAIPYIGALIPSTLGWGIVVFLDQVGMKKIQSIVKKGGVLGKGIMKIAEKADKISGKV